MPSKFALYEVGR